MFNLPITEAGNSVNSNTPSINENNTNVVGDFSGHQCEETVADKKVPLPDQEDNYFDIKNIVKYDSDTTDEKIKTIIDRINSADNEINFISLLDLIFTEDISTIKAVLEHERCDLGNIINNNSDYEFIGGGICLLLLFPNYISTDIIVKLDDCKFLKEKKYKLTTDKKIEIMKMLVNKGVDPFKEKKLDDNYGICNALQIAVIKKEDIEMIKYLSSLGLKNKKLLYGRTLLMEIAQNGTKKSTPDEVNEKLEFLASISQEGIINEQDKNGETVLHIYCRNEYYDNAVFVFLVNTLKADTTILDRNKKTILRNLAETGNLEKLTEKELPIVKPFINQKDINDIAPIVFTIPSDIEVQYENGDNSISKSSFDILLDLGADAQATDNTGETIFETVLYRKELNNITKNILMQKLIQHGALTSVKNIRSYIKSVRDEIGKHTYKLRNECKDDAYDNSFVKRTLENVSALYARVYILETIKVNQQLLDPKKLYTDIEDVKRDSQSNEQLKTIANPIIEEANKELDKIKSYFK